jgi:alcohol dehydrogenase (NADP+)
MTTTAAYLATSATGPLEAGTIERRPVGSRDVRIDIEYCGVCHSDLHTARNEWGGTTYPVTVGHEIIGRVAEVGAEVSGYAVGDRVGVGCMVRSCGECAECAAGLEQYCRRCVMTYNGVDFGEDGNLTHGGYSKSVVVTEHFVLRIPDGLDPAAAAPILCAGITMFSPLKLHNVGPGTKVGVVGFGGLGGMAVKLAKALGAEVSVITRSDRKSAEALKAGADAVVISSDKASLRAASVSLDLILSTIPTDHDLTPYLRLLKRDGVYVILGAIEPITAPLHGALVTARRLSVTGSMIGGIAETQEVLDFCAEHNINSDIQVIPIDQINDAYEQLHAGDPGYRYVIDMASLTG